MITDERLDQLIRSTLQWQSDAAARTQPTLRQQTGRLAARIAPSGATVRPRMTLAPATGGALNLVLILMLLLMLATAVYVGAQLLRQPPFVPPGQFGFAMDCSIPVDPGLAFDEATNPTVLRFTAPDGPDSDAESDYLAVYADGRLVQDVSQPGETRVDTVTGSRISVQRLSPTGVALLLDRVSKAGLSPGCRLLQTQQSSGALTAQTETGATDVSWGPSATSVSRLITVDAEHALTELTEDLASPEQWLPADAWLDDSARLVGPDHWLIYLTLRPSGHQPGDRIELPNGNVLSGSDPRIRSVDLPGGAEALTYGAALPLSDPAGAGSSIRCAEGSTEEAVALAGSLAALENELGTDGQGELFTEDLTQSVSFDFQPVFGGGYDCAALAATWQVAADPPARASPRPPTGDLAAIDPCTLVSVDAAALLGANDVERRASRLPLGTPAHACVVLDSNVEVELPDDVVDALPPGYRAIVSLYPHTLSAGVAQEVVDAVFGPGLVAEEQGDRRVWIRPCDSDGLRCGDTIVGWSRAHLLFLEFTNDATPVETTAPSGEWSMTWHPEITPEEARAFVDELLGDLEN